VTEPRLVVLIVGQGEATVLARLLDSERGRVRRAVDRPEFSGRHHISHKSEMTARLAVLDVLAETVRRELLAALDQG
jgi:hypothetical protein